MKDITKKILRIALIAFLILGAIFMVHRMVNLKEQNRVLLETQQELIKTCQFNVAIDSANAITISRLDMSMENIQESIERLEQRYDNISFRLGDLETNFSADVLAQVESKVNDRDTYYLLDGYSVPVRFYEREESEMNNVVDLNAEDERMDSILNDNQTRLAYAEYKNELRE